MRTVWKVVTAIITCLVLGSCSVFPNHGVDHPKNPPVFVPGPFSPNDPRNGVKDYQEALIKYISYLEQYYISIGIYYGGDTNPPLSKSRKGKDGNLVGENEFRCRVVEHIFKDIDLPPPPRTASKEVEETINNLIDHIVDLRKRIRSNNSYMETLRQKYKDCK